EIFKAMFREGAGWTETSGRLRIGISPQPKAEAAYGLVANYDLPDFSLFDEEAFDSLVAGEDFIVNQNTSSATSLLNREAIQKRPKIEKLDNLHRFVDVYNGFAAKPGWNLEPIRNMSDISPVVYQRIGQWINQQANLESKQVELEPLFIVALKAFLTEFLSTG